MDKNIKQIIIFFGSQKLAAEKIKVSQATVSLWLSGARKPSIMTCKKIEKITNGKFNINLLRPDLFN